MRALALVAGTVVAVLALGACSSAPPAPAPTTATHSQPVPPTLAVLAARYLAIATPANKVLDESFDALEDHEDDLMASAARLTTIAATERGFDRDLLALALPEPMAGVAAALVRVNEARASLTAQASTAGTVADLQHFQTRLDAMNPPVEDQVKVLRRDLGLPPPDTD